MSCFIFLLKIRYPFVQMYFNSEPLTPIWLIKLQYLSTAVLELREQFWDCHPRILWNPPIGFEYFY